MDSPGACRHASRSITSVTGEEPMARATLAVWVASLGPETGTLGPGQGPWSGSGADMRAWKGARAEGHTSPEGTRASSGTQPGLLEEPESQEAARRAHGAGQGEANAAPDPEVGVLAGGPTPPPRWRARRRHLAAGASGPCLSLRRWIQEESLPSGPGSPSSLPTSGEPLKGLLASGADTGLFCSFSPQPGPPYLVPCSPGRPRTSRSLLLSPTPSSGQARAGEALPTAPPVTSAPGRIPTLGLSWEGWAQG